jgi:hypothetical protein
MPALGSIFLIAANTFVADRTPLLLAEKGWMQCYQPNETNKTCESIAEYRRLKDGSYANTATVLISATQPISMKTITIVRIRSGAVCGSIAEADLKSGKVLMSGHDLPTEKASPILAKIAEAMAPNLNKEICTTYFREGINRIAKATIAGQSLPPEKQVKWIKPSDGYRVAPSQ